MFHVVNSELVHRTAREWIRVLTGVFMDVISDVLYILSYVR